MTFEPITASVDQDFLRKVDRVFDASPRTVFNELLQNARRAGANSVEVRFEERDGGTFVTFSDNGAGVESPELLLRLAASEWRQHIEKEDPAGMGFFCLSGFNQVSVASSGWRMQLSKEAFKGLVQVTPEKHVNDSNGTIISWLWEGPGSAFLAVQLEAAATYCGIASVSYRSGEVHKQVPVRDFLDVCVHTERGENYSMGVAPSTSRYSQTRSRFEVQVNFSGVNLMFEAALGDAVKDNVLKELACVGYDVRVDIHSAKGLQLVLPARNALRHTPERDTMIEEAGSLILRAIAALFKGRHSLSFAMYQHAASVGIDIGEAEPKLNPWRRYYGFHTSATAYRVSAAALPPYELEDMVAELQKKAIVVSTDTDPYVRDVFAAARRRHEIEWGEVFLTREVTGFKGYSWYDGVPTLTRVELKIDGEVVDLQAFLDGEFVDEMFRHAKSLGVEFHLSNGRVLNYEPEFLIAGTDRSFYLDGIDGSNTIYLVRDRITDIDTVADRIAEQLFEPSDDANADSNETQLNYFLTDLKIALVEELDGSAKAALEQLRASLRNLPDILRRFSWAVVCSGSGRYYEDDEKGAPNPRITSFREKGEGKWPHIANIAGLPGNTDGWCATISSETPITPERVQRYLSVEYGFDEEKDGFVLDGEPLHVDLDVWEENHTDSDDAGDNED